MMKHFSHYYKLFDKEDKRTRFAIMFAIFFLLLFLVIALTLPFHSILTQFFSKSPGKAQVIAGINRIWAINDGEKIKREDLNHPLADSVDNLVWQDGKITVFGGKNEVVAFQLIIQADSQNVNNVNVSLPSLSNGTTTIENTGNMADPYDYRGKHIELFTEDYVNVTQRSSANWLWLSSGRPSAYYLGWLPDPLVPFQAPSDLGGAPFSIPANNNQAVWVDIYIPRNATPGAYTGNLNVSVNGTTTHTIPVELQVYNFTLPDETHFKNMFYLSHASITNKHGVSFKSANYIAIEGRYHQMMHRHRADITPSTFSLSDMDTWYKRYLNGSFYTEANNYYGPGENVGNGTFSIGTYDMDAPGDFGNVTEAGWRAASDAWVNWFETNAPNVEYFKYMQDEPNSSAYPGIQMRADWVHNNPGPGKNLPIYVTTMSMPDSLIGYVDFWATCCANGYDITKANQRRAAGDKVGYYNGFRPEQGTVLIDTDATDFRVQPWIAWKYNVDQYYSFQTMPVRPASLYVDQWLAATQTQGDGVFFYPGEEKVITAENRGLKGPISSIKMKNWRRGQQDFEYLWLAEQEGLSSQATSIVNGIVPSALSDIAHTASQPTFPVRGHQYEAARRQLAQLLDPNTTFTPTTTQTVTGTINVNPSSQNIVVGNSFTVTVQVNGGGTAFNAAQVDVEVSPNLQVTGLTNGNCNFSYTAGTTPSTANPSFAGAILNGSSTDCTVYTLTLQSLSAGTGTVTLTNGSVKAYSDSNEIFVSSQNGTYTATSPTATPNPTPTPTATPVPPTATPTPTRTPTPIPPTATPIPTIEPPIISTDVPTKTYKSSLILTGQKVSNVSQVFVNGTSSGVTYPNATSWQKTIVLNQGINNFIIYGITGATQTTSNNISITKHKLADIDGSGTVDLTDLSLFGADWGKQSDAASQLLSNMNEDGIIDLTDFSILAREYEG